MYFELTGSLNLFRFATIVDMKASNKIQENTNLHSIPALQAIRVRDGIDLRPLSEVDGPSLLAILDSDPNIRIRVTVASRLHDAESIRKEVALYRSDQGLIRYTILARNKPIGLVSLWRDSGFFGDAIDLNAYGFGYFLDPQERGKGIITNTVTRLMEVVSSILPVSQFMAFSEDNNLASTGILTKLGFERTDQTFTEPINGWLGRKYVKAYQA
jgi:RimJ/RimL family protein N-acetyltransferase